MRIPGKNMALSRSELKLTQLWSFRIFKRVFLPINFPQNFTTLKNEHHRLKKTHHSPWICPKISPQEQHSVVKWAQTPNQTALRPDTKLVDDPYVGRQLGYQGALHVAARAAKLQTGHLRAVAPSMFFSQNNLRFCFIAFVFQNTKRKA